MRSGRAGGANISAWEPAVLVAVGGFALVRSRSSGEGTPDDATSTATHWLPTDEPDGWALTSVGPSSILSTSGLTFLTGDGVRRAIAITVFEGTMDDTPPGGSRSETLAGRPAYVFATGALVNVRVQIAGRWLDIDAAGVSEADVTALAGTVKIVGLGAEATIDAQAPAGMTAWERWDTSAIVQELHYQVNERDLAHLFVSTRPDQLTARIVSMVGPLTTRSVDGAAIDAESGTTVEPLFGAVRSSDGLGLAVFGGNGARLDDEFLTALVSMAAATDTDWAAAVNRVGTEKPAPVPDGSSSTTQPAPTQLAPATWFGLVDPRVDAWTSTQSSDGHRRQIVYRGRSADSASWSFTVTTADAGTAVPTTAFGSDRALSLGARSAFGTAENGLLQAHWNEAGVEVEIQLSASNLDRDQLVALAGTINPIEEQAVDALRPQLTDFSAGTPSVVTPADDPSVGYVELTLEALGATVRTAVRDRQVGTLVAAVADSASDQLTVAIGDSGSARLVEEPQLINDSFAGRTVRWWGPLGRNFEITVPSRSGGQHPWTIEQLKAIVRSFEPAPGGDWSPPDFAGATRPTSTIKG